MEKKELCPIAPKCHIFPEVVQRQQKVLLTSMKRENPLLCDCQRPLALLCGNHTLDNFAWLGM